MSPPREAPDEIVLSDRLRLIALTGPVIADVIGNGCGVFLDHVGVPYPVGWPAEDRNVLDRRSRQIAAGDDHRWLIRAMVTRSRPVMVGRIGFHGPPDENGMVEIGYRVDAAHRRQGFALEAATRLIEAAEEVASVSTVRASIAPDNEPSLRIAERLGFGRIGEQMDEIDGLELVFERRPARGR